MGLLLLSRKYNNQSSVSAANYSESVVLRQYNDISSMHMLYSNYHMVFFAHCGLVVAVTGLSPNQ